MVLIPAPLSGTAVVYTKGLFTLQCVAAATFVFVSAVLVIFVSLPQSKGDALTAPVADRRGVEGSEIYWRAYCPE